MNDKCSCMIDGCQDGYCEFHVSKIVTARKEHRCGECFATIKPGEQYERVRGKYDGDIFHAKTCMACAEVRDCFCCSWSYEALWQDIQDNVFGIEFEKINVNLEKLSKRARDKFFEMVDLEELEE